MAKISRFYCCHKISIGGPRCRGPQGTLTDWLCTVIYSDSSTQSILPPYAPLMSQGIHLRIRVGRDIFIRTARFERYECCSLAYSEWFLEKSTGVKSFQFRLFCRVRPLILQPWKKSIARFCVRMAKISWFSYRHKISITGPRCRGPQGTLTDWLCSAIHSDSST